ncbi:MAG: hypothetical protein KGN16_23960 [Burkholderiales bacterium]|nr:hypothetical protein [Burkholderiales bacterium]
MPIPASVGAFAIVPINSLAAAQPFWELLGFQRTGGDANYIIMTGWRCEVHLTRAGSGPWRVPEEHKSTIGLEFLLARRKWMLLPRG